MGTPVKGAPPSSNIASLGPKERGRPLRLKVGSPVSDGGYITEASIIGEGRGCTRSGQNMVIDYILVGSVCQVDRSGDSNTIAAQQCVQGVVNTSAVRVASATQSVSASDPKSGVKFSVQEFGSDHLPVATDVFVNAQCK